MIINEVILYHLMLNMNYHIVINKSIKNLLDIFNY